MSRLLMVTVAVALSISVQAQTSQFSRGEVVRLQPTADGTTLPDSRIIAVGGDRIKVVRADPIKGEKAAILVNNQPVSNVSPEMLLQFVAGDWDQVVPNGHYVVLGERHEPSSVVRYNGLIPAAKIVGRANR